MIHQTSSWEYTPNAYRQSLAPDHILKNNSLCHLFKEQQSNYFMLVPQSRLVSKILANNTRAFCPSHFLVANWKAHGTSKNGFVQRRPGFSGCVEDRCQIYNQITSATVWYECAASTGIFAIPKGSGWGVAKFEKEYRMQHKSMGRVWVNRFWRITLCCQWFGAGRYD